MIRVKFLFIPVVLLNIEYINFLILSTKIIPTVPKICKLFYRDFQKNFILQKSLILQPGIGIISDILQ